MSVKENDCFEVGNIDLEAIPSPVLVVEKETVSVKHINQLARDFIRCSPEEILESSLQNIISDAPRRVIDKLLQSAENKKNEPVLCDLHSGDDIRQVHIRPSYYAPNGSEYLILSLEDVTNHIKSRQELKTINQQLRSEVEERKQREQELRVKDNAIESAFNGMVISNPDGEIFYVNDAFVDMFGFESKEDAIGTHPLDLHPEDEHQKVKESLDIIREKGAWQSELKALKKTGELFDVQINTSRVRDQDGNVTCIMASFEDITERKQHLEEIKAANQQLDAYNQQLEATEQQLRAEVEERKQIEARLRESKNEFEALFMQSSVSMFVHDKDSGEIIDANPAAYQSHGFSSLEELKNNDFWLEPPYSFQEALDLIHRVGPEGPQDYQWCSRDKSGDIFWEQVHLAPITISGIERVLAVTVDITKRKQAEEKIKNSLREKETLLKEVHHRVKNNMQIISSMLMLQSHYIGDERLAEIVKECNSRIRSMALVHEQLYRSADLSSINFRNYVQKLVDKMFSTHHGLVAGIKRVINADEIGLDIDTSIPCGLILQELVSNSLQHAFKDGKEGELEINFGKVQEKNDTPIYELKVTDTGPGLSEDIDIETAESLGLQLVKTLVEDNLQGDMEIDSSKGASFKITFPAQG